MIVLTKIVKKFHFCGVTKAWILKVPAPATPQAFSHVQAHVSSQHLLLQKIMKKNMVLISYLQKPAFLQYLDISKEK